MDFTRWAWPALQRHTEETRLRRPRTALILGVVTILAACGEGVPDRTGAGKERVADLILTGGRVVTLDEALPEAETIAIRGDRIVYVGSDEGAAEWRGPESEIVDLGGRLTIPGFIEGHAHLMGLGQSLLQVQLLGTRSYEEVIGRVAEAVATAAPGEWVLGRGWHQSKWDSPPDPSIRGFPFHDSLSAVSPENAVWLRHASGHATLANRRAMELAGITSATPDPPGGAIVRSEDGTPTGVFLERASDLILDAWNEYRSRMSEEETYAEARQALRLAIEEALGKGITSFQDAGVLPATIDLYRDALADGELRLRVWAMLSAETEDLEHVLPRVRVIGLGDDRLTVRAVKAYADGALGSRGAWLLEPYADDPLTAGLNVVPLSEIRRVVELALEHGYQVGTHAIGDRANREVLDIYATAFARHPEAARDARFRIEHAQIVHPNDAARFAGLGVIAAMQGIHAISDGPWTPDRLGPERTRERAYQFRRLLDSGAIVINGTDAPVEDVDPIPSFYGATAGRMNDGAVLNPDQLMTREEALRSYTIDAAYAAHEEELKGTLTPGKLADLVVLSRDLLRVPEEEIPGTKVVMTVVGGEVVYRGGE